MATFSQKFIALSLEQAALRFGSFTLKSGRTSPYFFNAGAFQTGSALSRLGHLYAECIMAADIDFDVLFGPAYKGIPLVAATACALADSHERDLPWAFNRKEAKTHGEGGCFVGAGLEGKSVLILDDVITAGTAIRDVMGQLQQVGARPAGVVVALDRAEKGPDSDRSAIQAVRDAFGIPVFSIARLDDLLAWVASDTRLLEFREAMLAYRNQWGVDECT